MARFKYDGRDAKSIRTGVIVAADKREAAMKLKSQGIRVTNLTVQAETALTKEIVIGKPVKREHFIMFLRQFSTLLERALQSSMPSGYFLCKLNQSRFTRYLIQSMMIYGEGDHYRRRLRKHPKAFESIVVNMIQAGEMSGTIDDSLDRLADHFEKSHQLRQKVISAIVLSVIVVGILAIGVVIFLLTTIVPMFVDMFASFGGELPWLTRFVMNASNFVTSVLVLVHYFYRIVVVGIWMIRSNRKVNFCWIHFF